MEFKLSKTQITEDLQSILSVIPINTSVPILGAVSLEFIKEKLILTATDLEVFIQKKAFIKSTAKEQFIIPGKKFAQILNKMPKEEILISKIDNKLQIKSGKCKFELPLFNSKDYPKYPEVDGYQIKYNTQDLKDILTKIVFACSQEGTQIGLTGILFDFNKKKLNLVATDGKRLALARQKMESDYESQCIIPRKAILNLLDIMHTTDKTIDMIISNDQGLITFQNNNIKFTTKTINVKYPSYQAVIPKENSKVLKINTIAFRQAIDRANIMSTLTSVTVEIKLEKNKITIFKTTPGMGKEQEEIEATYTGKEFTIGFNSRYLLDILNNINEKEIELKFKDEQSACLIIIKNKYIYLLLPMVQM